MTNSDDTAFRKNLFQILFLSGMKFDIIDAEVKKMRVLKFNSVFLGIIVFVFFGSLSFSNERTEEGFKGILVPTIVLDKKFC